jgi:hypothetical protein
VLGLFLVRELHAKAVLEDCLLSGRTNCSALVAASVSYGSLLHPNDSHVVVGWLLAKTAHRRGIQFLRKSNRVKLPPHTEPGCTQGRDGLQAHGGMPGIALLAAHASIVYFDDAAAARQNYRGPPSNYETEIPL